MSWRRAVVVLGWISVVSGPIVATVPPSPNLAGHWTRESDDRITDDASRARMAHAPDGFCGDGCRITQDAKTLRVVRDTLPNSPTLVFTLDGAESTNKFATPDGEISMTSVAGVDGDHIAIDSQVSRGDLQLSERLTMTTRDGTLEVDFHSGGRSGRPETIHKQIFRRVSRP